MIDNELEDFNIAFFAQSTIFTHEYMSYYLTLFTLVCMQDGTTPAFMASHIGHTETLALLLANKADINAATEVHQFKIFKYL